MGVSTTNNRTSYTGNGVTTAFSFPYKFLLEEDLVVVKRLISDGTETVQTLTTHYTVTGEGDAAGGTVTMLAAPSALYQLVIYSDPDLTQEVNFEENDSSPAEVQEGALDKLTIITQRLKNRVDRAIRLSDGFSPTFDPTLPVDLDDSAGKVPLINATGDGFADAADWPSSDDIEDAEENAAAAAASASAALVSATAAGVSEAAAAVSATAAQAAVNSVIWRDVVFKTFANSPITIADSDRGKLFVISTAGGNVVVNLPSIAALTLTTPWAFAIKKSTSDTNTITVNRNGTDTINGLTSVTIDTGGGGLVVIPDTDPAPDEWTTQVFGAIDDASVTNAKLAQLVFNALTTVTPVAADFLAGADTSDSGNKKKFAVSAIRNAVVRSVTTTDAVGPDDETLVLSSASFTSTLPAIGAATAGKRYRFIHGGTSLTQVYALATTGGNTIGGVASGSYALYTNGEMVEVQDPGYGTDWLIVGRKARSGWVDAGSAYNFVTFTISSGSGTLAATYTPTYVFTITAGNTASVGAIYSNNGNNYTLVQALLVGDTTVITTGAAAPAASGSLVYVSGTHTGGNLTFSSVAGEANTKTYTVAKTVASGLTLVTSGTAVPTNSSGKIAKASGTGDAVITYSAYAGLANTMGGTTTAPIAHGDSSPNTVKYRRDGQYIEQWVNLNITTAGIGGSGDYLYPVVPNVTIDTTAFPVYTGGVAQAAAGSVAAYANAIMGNNAGGLLALPAGNYFWVQAAVPYTSTSFRLYGPYGAANVYPNGSTQMTFGQVESISFIARFPVSGWQP